MTPKQKAAVEKNLVAGEEARSMLASATKGCPECGQGSSVFLEREQQIIREATNWYKTPGASNDLHYAVRYIAALSELRSLRDALEYRAKKGEEAQAALYNGTTATTE